MHGSMLSLILCISSEDQNPRCKSGEGLIKGSGSRVSSAIYLRELTLDLVANYVQPIRADFIARFKRTDRL